MQAARHLARRLATMARPARGVAIDAWAQPPHPTFMERLPEVKRLLEQSHSPDRFHDEKNCTPDALAAELDASGVGHAMLSAWHRPGQVVVSNERVAEFTTAYPSKFSGIAAVDLEDPVGAVKELTRCVEDYGFKALRVVQWLWERPPTDALYYPLYVRCVELGIPVCLQVGHTGPLKPSETGRPVPYIDEIALTFPDLVIVGGHIGYPWTEEMIAVAWKHENVYIDTSAYLPRYYPPALVQYMSTGIGRHKVLFGTNMPQLTWDKCLSQVEELGLDEKTRAAFLYGNARRVFGLDNSVLGAESAVAAGAAAAAAAEGEGAGAGAAQGAHARSKL